MTPSGRDRRVALIGAAGSLTVLERRLARRGWRPVRLEAIRTVPVRVRSVPTWLERRPPADLWIVTSRAVVTTFLASHPEWMRRLRTVPKVVAVGPETAGALRDAKIGPIRHGTPGGSAALLAGVGPVKGLRIVYLRSDRAGPELARRLRADGARVMERIVYRTRAGRRLPRDRRESVGSIPVWVVASPSALFGFRRMVGGAVFRRYRRTVEGFAIGDRTARAMRESGVRGVRSPKESSEEGFTKLLEKTLGDAPRSVSSRRR